MRLTLDVGFEGSGFRLSGSGFRFSGFGSKLQGNGFRLQASGFRVSGLGCRDEPASGSRLMQARRMQMELIHRSYGYP